MRPMTWCLLSAGALAWMLTTALACAPARSAPAAAVEASASAQATAATSNDLPDGPGKRILETSCLWCHEVREVTKFRGYWVRAQWRDVIVTMVEYGARLQTNDIEVLTDYLTEHLGRRATASTP